MVSDPIETVLQDLGKMRERAYNGLLRLPAPSPFKGALQNIDGLLSRLEVDIRLVQAAVPRPPLAPPPDVRPGGGLRGWLRSISLPPLP